MVQDAYEYHGLNDLALYIVFAGITTLVLFFHWTGTTGSFKNTMQTGFQSYGNPDWQTQELKKVETMYDGVEYITGFLQYNLRISETASEWDWGSGLLAINPYTSCPMQSHCIGRGKVLPWVSGLTRTSCGFTIVLHLVATCIEAVWTNVRNLKLLLSLCGIVCVAEPSSGTVCFSVGYLNGTDPPREA